MPLNIFVLKNYLSTSPEPFVVRSNCTDIVEFDRFVDIMAESRTTVSRADIVAVMQVYKEELRKQLFEGRMVKTPTGSFYLSAAGTMAGLDDSYLPKDKTNNHAVRLHHRPEGLFEESILADLEISREERPDLSVPSLRDVQAAGEDSGLIHPGGLVRLRGLRLRFDPKAREQGVFFVDGAGIESRSSFYPTILPGTVLAGVPESLIPGDFRVALRAAVNGRDIHEARFEPLIIST